MVAIYDVLKASKGIHVDDTFAELWGRKLSNAYTVATYTGTLPATLTGTKAGYLESYKIYGNAVQNGTPTPENPIIPSGCGVRTENLFDYQTMAISVLGSYLDATGQEVASSDWKISDYIPCNGKEFTINKIGGNVPAICLYDENKQFFTGKSYQTGSAGRKIPVRISSVTNAKYIRFSYYSSELFSDKLSEIVITEGITTPSDPSEYIPYGYKLPLTVNGVEYPIYIGNEQLAKDEYVDSETGKIYRRTKNLSPPKEEWTDEWIWGDGTVHPSTEIKVSPFIDVSTCETCIMEVFFTETAWAAAGFREMAFYDENKQYLGWIGGGGRQALTPKSSESLSEFPAGTVYVRIGCSHGDQLFYPQLVSGYTPTHQFYPYLIPTDPPASFPQIPTFAGTTTIDYNGEPKPDKVELTYKKRKGQ